MFYGLSDKLIVFNKLKVIRSKDSLYVCLSSRSIEALNPFCTDVLSQWILWVPIEKDSLKYINAKD